MTRPAIILAALLLLLAAALALKDPLIALPEVRDTSAGGFDTKRAMARLGRILGDERPHPVDSGDNDLVRARLIAELEALGLNPRITDDFVCNGSAKSRTVSCARVRNVVATMGPAEGPHLLLVSHYDSTPVGPGAADDGIGVAVMLETAAQLRRRTLERPVSFLFNEGEEAGLLGARAFMARHPLASRVGTLVNFEARGVSGPATMFETSRPDAPAVRLYRKAAERPSANSLAAHFARLIPNRTDVAVFQEGDWTILNFAIIGNETRYHSPGDTLAALDPRTVQHMGDQALALASTLGSGGSPSGTGNVNYTDLLSRALIVIPTPAALTALAATLLGIGFFAWRRRFGLGRAVLAVAAALLGGTALTFLAQGAVKLAREGDYWRAWPIATDLAVYATILLAAVAALLLIARNSTTERLHAAFWLLFVAIGAAASAALPGAAIFFLLPAAPILAGMALERVVPRSELVGAIIGAVVLFLLWAPLLALMGLLLRHGAAVAFAPVAAAIALPWLIEAKPFFAGARPRPALIALAAVAGLGWIATALLPAYSDDRKQIFGIEYVRDEARARGRWMIANDGAPLPGAFAAIGDFEKRVEVPWSSRKRWAAPAPDGLAEAPAVTLLAERAVAEGRLVSLRLAANGAETITLRAPPEALVRAVRAGGWSQPMGGRDREGNPATDGSDDYVIRCHGRRCDALRIEMLLGSKAPTVWTVAGVRRGLPAAARPLVAARPANAAPQYTADATVGVGRFRL